MARLQLSELYQLIDSLQKLKYTVPEDLEQKISQAEEEIIKMEILPILKQKIEPALQQVKRELVLVVDYVPGNPLSLHLSRKSNVTAEIADAKEIVLDPEVEHGTRKGGKDFKRSPNSEMAVSFPDGTIFAEQFATDTLEKVVRKIGVQRVREAVRANPKLVLCHVPLISNRRDGKYSRQQRDLGEGWLLMTHSSNKQKKKVLDMLSDDLNLGLEVIVLEDDAGKEPTSPAPKSAAKHPQDRSRYALEGKPFATKNNFVRDIVHKLMIDRPAMTYKQLEQTLPLRSTNNKTIITAEEWSKKNPDARSRYRGNPEQPYVSSDGIRFYLSTQWDHKAFRDGIIPMLARLGYKWQKSE